MHAILFMLMLPLLAGFSFLVQSQSNFSIILEGACKDICDANRPSSHAIAGHQPYTFDCTNNENENCSKACVSCPARVCSEYDRKRFSEKSYNYTFHCPPVVLPNSGKCYNRCDLNRYKGSRGDYSFSCKDDISPDKQGCNTCDDGNCPTTVCKPDSYTVYYCPYDLSESVCEERCDRNRGYTNVKPFKLSCSSQSDETVCKTECNLCSNYICDHQGDGSTYNCPHPQMIGFDECRQLCIKHRHSYNDDEYVLNCNEHYDESTCTSFCNKCPNYVCEKSGSNLFHCPKKQNPSLAYFTGTRRWYKGKCKDRCDKSRGGGTYGFELKCESRYSSEQEKALCLNECINECPEDACFSNNTIVCKEMLWETGKIEKEKEEFKISLENEYDLKKRSIFSKLKAVVIALIVLLVITLLATSLFLWCTLRKKRVAPEVVNGRTLSMQEVHSVRELSSSPTSASTSTLEQKPARKSIARKPRK